MCVTATYVEKMKIANLKQRWQAQSNAGAYCIIGRLQEIEEIIVRLQKDIAVYIKNAEPDPQDPQSEEG